MNCALNCAHTFKPLDDVMNPIGKFLWQEPTTLGQLQKHNSTLGNLMRNTMLWQALTY